jgi:putative flavoprotein involved in K+ transport
MRPAELVALLENYAADIAAPLLTDTAVLSVARYGDGYRVRTDRGTFFSRAVVLATGYAQLPLVPSFASELPRDITQVTSATYKNPDSLPPGGVLVVGASASGVQLAEEVQRSGRPVTLSVGQHNRMVRRYRGRDIMWWLDRMGILSRAADEVSQLEEERLSPSLQLVGRPDFRTTDLAYLQSLGIQLMGRAKGASGDDVYHRDDLAQTTSEADQKLERLLQRVDRFADQHGLSQSSSNLELPAVRTGGVPTRVNLRKAGIRSVLWCTGFRRSYPWLHIPVCDSRGELVHRAGITSSPGLFALGLMFQQRRSSTYIDGVGRDAEDLAVHISNHLSSRTALSASRGTPHADRNR